MLDTRIFSIQLRLSIEFSIDLSMSIYFRYSPNTRPCMFRICRSNYVFFSICLHENYTITRRGLSDFGTSLFWSRDLTSCQGTGHT